MQFVNIIEKKADGLELTEEEIGYMITGHPGLSDGLHVHGYPAEGNECPGGDRPHACDDAQRRCR